MAWMSKSDAAIALGLSPLVLSRKIAVGKFPVKSAGRRVLVDVPDQWQGDKVAVKANGKLADDVESVAVSRDVLIPLHKLSVRQAQVDGPRASQATSDARIAKGDDDGTGVKPKAERDPADTIAEPRDGDTVAAALDAVDRVRVVCDREVAFAREEAERAWRSCEQTEGRLRKVVWIAASILVASLIGVAWLDRSHAEQLQTWAAKVAELDASLVAVESRESGQIDGLRATLSTFRDDAAGARDGLHGQLADARAELAATRVELDHVCWERDEAMRQSDRLENEVAGQREHIEKMQLMQANLAARTLQRLIDESWDVKPDTPSVFQERVEFSDKSVTVQRSSGQ